MQKTIQLFLFIALFFGATVASAQKITIIDGTANAGKVEWVRQVDLGDIPFDVPATAFFSLKNVSKEPLILLDVHSSCGCTVVEATKEPILPGGETTIKAVYNARTEGAFYKLLTVTTNFDKDNSVTLSIIGTVKKK
ncbi:MAG: hypothetical protein RLZZ292_547 [Bacteroidota bacterium]|jgi:hypothetical protein